MVVGFRSSTQPTKALLSIVQQIGLLVCIRVQMLVFAGGMGRVRPDCCSICPAIGFCLAWPGIFLLGRACVLIPSLLPGRLRLVGLN